jgi:DUF3052 family protein
VALVAVSAGCDVVGLLRHWASALQQAGGIWLLSPKRGLPGYVDQRDLIAAGGAAGLVDNKACSLSQGYGRRRHHPGPGRGCPHRLRCQARTVQVL